MERGRKGATKEGREMKAFAQQKKKKSAPNMVCYYGPLKSRLKIPVNHHGLSN